MYLKESKIIYLLLYGFYYLKSWLAVLQQKKDFIGNKFV